MTAEEFEQFVALPENDDKYFELIGGEIVELPSNPYSSKIAALIIAALITYLKTNDLGHVTGQGGGFRVSGERYAPDVAFISKKRQPELPRQGYNPIAPDFAVEVVSPTDSHKKLLVKVANYLAAGTLVWIVYPEGKEVEVYAPGKPMMKVGFDGTLNGGKLLPGFKLAVKDIF